MLTASTPTSKPGSSSESACQVAAAAIALLDQCEAFVRGVGAREFAAESRAVHGGTIGKHIRHSLDHFRACLDSVGPGAVADYDQRERNVPMETDPARALEAIASIRARLGTICDESLQAPVRVRVMLSGDGVYAELRSTLGRELAFAAHHAVHHHAMLATIAQELGLRTEPGFGKAPSTISHERKAR